ncbi:unnamed protein product [Paramecium sonneborni]|uniref:Uncharacterized protein n=1 Tax=Paramecium sonneborni TaxID=65129 RepID=A0A8S1PG90_9CILI|nr:unnamed protein product [Paramecium sonneborni]
MEIKEISYRDNGILCQKELGEKFSKTSETRLKNQMKQMNGLIQINNLKKYCKKQK